jgi:hypothetical protein
MPSILFMVRRIPARHSLTGTAWLAVAALALASGAAPLRAFDSKGHVVIETLAYRTLVEGHDGNPPRPEVLRDLFNDGALVPPLCFGWGANPPAYCADATLSTANPLLDWPKPLTDQPDAAFRRQFSDAGQCFHFMATLDDAESPDMPGTEIPRALATNALVRCRDLLDDLLRQVVLEGGPGTRRSGYGLYELMHAVGDSFSRSHTQRRANGEIEELRVWKPLTRLPGLTPEALKRIPDSAFHKWDDHRDKTYVIEDRETPQGECKHITDQPYRVPYECLSEEGDHARQALVELLVVVRALRVERLHDLGDGTGSPEKSDSWRRYKDRWFAPAFACEGAECSEQQMADLTPGAYGFVGLQTVYNSSRNFFDAAASGMILKYSSGLNPFVYALAGEVGYRHYDDGGGAGLLGLELDLILPIGKRAALGFVPAAWRVTFGGEKTGSELTSDFFRFDYLLSDHLALTMRGPLSINWRRPAAELSFGLGLSYSLQSARIAGSPLIQRSTDKVERSDETWTPPEAPYGRLLGRNASWYAGIGITTAQTPEIATENRQYGEGSVGGAVMWDRDRWGGRFVWVPGASLSLAARRTSGESVYLTGVLEASIRWYALRVLGLSITPVRLEGGPKIRGDDELDTSPGVHGTLGSQYYFQAGSRLGIAFNAGIIDLLVEGPTIAWRSDPFAAHEVLSVHLGIRLN